MVIVCDVRTSVDFFSPLCCHFFFSPPRFISTALFSLPLSVLFLLHLFSLPVCITSSSSSPPLSLVLLSLSSSSKTSHATKCSAVVIYVHGLSFFVATRTIYSIPCSHLLLYHEPPKFAVWMCFFLFFLFHLNVKFKWNEVVGKKEIDTHRHYNQRRRERVLMIPNIGKRKSERMRNRDQANKQALLSE